MKRNEYKYVYHEYDFDDKNIGPIERVEMERADDIEYRLELERYIK